MAYKIARDKPGRRQGPRVRRVAAMPTQQYSLFAASGAAASDARHFRRQAQLCRRLCENLHQLDLVELLSELESEFEAKAERIEAAAPAARA
jgi:hypothetical protein